MTDYNDGNWHGWKGGECPVHPESEIEGYWQVEGAYTDQVSKSAIYNTGLAGGLNFEWGGHFNLHLFRVTKQYVEPPKPREFWINVYADAIGSPYSVFEDEQRAIDYTQKGLTQRIYVREVIEE